MVLQPLAHLSHGLPSRIRGIRVICGSYFRVIFPANPNRVRSLQPPMALVSIAFTVLTLVAALAPDHAIGGAGTAVSTQAEADADGLTPLMRAAARGDLAQVTALLGKGSDPDASTPAQRVTALMCAAYFGHTPVIKALLGKGAKMELKDAQGAAAVDWAALGDHAELEKTLTGPNVSLNPFLNTGIMPIWLMDKAAGK